MKTNRAIEIWEESWQNAHESINTLVFQMGAIDPDIADLNPEIPTEALCAQELTEKTKKINELISGITTIADQLKEEWQSWLETKETSPWKKDFDFVVNRYQDLTKKLLEQGIHDISEYGSLIQKKEAIEEEIRSYDSLIEILQEYKRQESELLSEINDHRYQLTEKRKRFLSKYLNGKSQIIMRIIPFGDKSSAEETLREILNIKGNQASFLSSSDDKSGILDTLSFKMNASRQDEKKEEISLSHLNAVKKILYRLCDGEEIDGFDNRLLKSLKKCSPEQLDKIAFWFPKDTLYIGYWDEKKGEYKDITEGSPGQKNAAILYFILRYGTNPLILDQPEDDLDNHLIFNLIVTLLQGLKEKRQVIIITHNANIVVNGNADLIIPFKSEHENTIINNQGTLQDREVREEICSLMEGGRNAFEQRYTRILKE
ncbi:MAG: ATP-binding protein [Methanospirillum hungatei]|nr:hypothetical protein [Methanospirillum hungatei]MCA1916564.1 ATP-binding protein [Methanospirillum hungatei]